MGAAQPSALHAPQSLCGGATAPTVVPASDHTPPPRDPAGAAISGPAVRKRSRAAVRAPPEQAARSHDRTSADGRFDAMNQFDSGTHAPRPRVAIPLRHHTRRDRHRSKQTAPPVAPAHTSGAPSPHAPRRCGDQRLHSLGRASRRHTMPGEASVSAANMRITSDPGAAAVWITPRLLQKGRRGVGHRGCGGRRLVLAAPVAMLADAIQAGNSHLASHDTCLAAFASHRADPSARSTAGQRATRAARSPTTARRSPARVWSVARAVANGRRPPSGAGRDDECGNGQSEPGCTECPPPTPRVALPTLRAVVSAGDA
jgi:hypothetical protein